eukprot:Selendium_serpulae@DN7917_c0_g1_i1.p1
MDSDPFSHSLSPFSIHLSGRFCLSTHFVLLSFRKFFFSKPHFSLTGFILPFASQVGFRNYPQNCLCSRLASRSCRRFQMPSDRSRTLERQRRDGTLSISHSVRETVPDTQKKRIMYNYEVLLSD